MEINPVEIRRGLDILHGGAVGFREFRLLCPERKRAPVIRYFHTEVPAEVISGWIDEVGDGRNAYVGRNPRHRDLGVEAGTSGDTLWATAVSLDIDPTSVESGQASRYADGLSRVLGGAIIDSGRGFQVWCPLDKAYDVQGRQEWFTACCKRWEADVVLKTLGSWEPEGCKVDRQHDLARIVRVPGTINRKTGGVARILHPPASTILVDSVLAFRVDERRSASGIPSRNIGILDSGRCPVPARFWRVLGYDHKLRESWVGARADLSDTSGSGQDMALVARLRILRFTPEEAMAILKAKPNKERAREGYYELTVSKAYGGAQ